MLEAWARGLAALASASLGTPEARETALGAESAGRAAGSQPARMYAYAALADVDEVRGAEYALLAETVASETGLVVPRAQAPAEDAGDEAAGDVEAASSGRGSGRRVAAAIPPGASPGNGRAPTIRVRTLGGFALDVDGRRVLLDGAKPRVRTLLRLLAVHAGAPVHREVIQDALWPEADATAGARSLHVALSALRRWLDQVGGPRRRRARGPGGRRLPAGRRHRRPWTSGASIGRWPRAAPPAPAASSRRRPTRWRSSCTAASCCRRRGRRTGSSARRDHYREAAVEAAGELASESLLAGDFGTAVRACRSGLEIDRYQDPLWRILIEARDRAGDTGAASRDRREYAAILEGLGVGGAASASARHA